MAKKVSKSNLIKLMQGGVDRLDEHQIKVLEYSESLITRKYWIMVVHGYTSEIIYQFRLTDREYQKLSLIKFKSRKEMYQEDFTKKLRDILK